jgi:hypothetical protein
MATRAFTAAFCVDALAESARDWNFLWAEYQALRIEAELYWHNVVRPAEARIDSAIARYIPDPEARTETMIGELAELPAKTVAGYALIHQIHAGLVEQACQLESELLLAPAPDEESLLWKLNRVVELETTCAAVRHSVCADSHRLLGQVARG